MDNRFSSLFVSVALIVVFLWVVTTKEAHAYMDLPTGSFLIQILFASLFAAMYVAKAFWQRWTGRLARILSFIRGRSDTPKSRQ